MIHLLQSGHYAEFALACIAMVVAITFHEYAHARVALAFGDRTAESQGRVTLDPVAHLDPMGTIGFLVGSFGWGRPVPVDRGAFRHPRADLLVSAAGPVSNLAVATLAGLAMHALRLGAGGYPPAGMLGEVDGFLYQLIRLNLALGFFNLLPLFPLDGSHMLENLLPLDKAYAFGRFGQAYGMQILLGLILLGFVVSPSPLGLLLWPPIELVTDLITP